MMKDPGQLSKRIVVAASGAGRSLENIIKCQKKFDFSYSVSGVILSNPTCGAVDVARKYNIRTTCDRFGEDGQISSHLLNWLLEINPDWIVLAGFLKKFPIDFPKQKWNGKIVNIHPALLPKYGGKGMYGKKVHQAVVEAGEEESGATVHFVNSRYDEGHIISQAKTIVTKNDNYLTLAKKVFELECDLFPKTIANLINGTLPLQNGQIKMYDLLDS